MHSDAIASAMTTMPQAIKMNDRGACRLPLMVTGLLVSGGLDVRSFFTGFELSYFTNYILDKYGIKDENAANIIYMAVIEYGKEYKELYNTNPLTTLSESDIFKVIYQRVSDMTRDENNNDLWKDFNITV